MEYYAGLDVSLEKTHICVLDRDGVVVHEATALSSPASIATALGEAPACVRVVFETGHYGHRYYGHSNREWHGGYGRHGH